MKRILIFLLLCMSVSTLSAQGFVKGKVLDKQNSEPLGFVNVRITQKASGAFVGGGMTDSEGNFTVKNLKNVIYPIRSI